MRKPLSEDVLAYFRAQGAKGGRKAARTMTKEQRTARAHKGAQGAAAARLEKKHRAKKG